MKVKLGEVCSIAASRTPLQDDSVWLLNLDMVEQQTGRVIDYVYINRKALGASTVAFDEDVVLYSKLRPNLNKVVLPDRSGYATSEMLPLRPNADLNREYLAWYLRSPSFMEYAVGKVSGAKMPRLGTSVLLETQLELPAIIEQKRIADVFFGIDYLIGKRKQQLQKLDELVKARFVEMFGDNESNPKGWKQSRIGDCCTLKSGTSLPAEVENEGGPIPYVKVGDMNYPGNERYITASSRYVSTTTAGNGLFAVGSILFPKRGGAIGTNKKRMTTLPICADLNIMGVSSNGALLPEYLLTYFDMIDLGALSDGSSVPQINNKNIAPLLICLPPMELQREFATFVSQVDKSKLSIQASLDQLETLKQSLMQKYFG